MISISAPFLSEPVCLDSGITNVLVIENPSLFYKTVMDFSLSFAGEETEVSFWIDDKEFDPDKSGVLVVDVFGMSFTNATVTKLLYKKLESDYNEGEFIVALSKLNTGVAEFYDKLFALTDFKIAFSELSIQSLLKASAVQPEIEFDSLLEKIVCFINMYSALKKVDFFVFVNLKAVLKDEEIRRLYEHCELSKIALLLVESSMIRPRLKECEKTTIITEDLCEIVAS